jgi:hypothetical protein
MSKDVLLPRYISLTVLTSLENDAPLNLSHREGDLMKHKVSLIEKEGKIIVKAKRSGNAVKSAHRRGIMELNKIPFTTCNPSTVIGEATQCCTRCKGCVIHGYATASSRRSSLFHATDMISVEADVVKAYGVEPSELANIMASLEMAPREVVKIEQHLTLPPQEGEPPMPFRVEKVQAGTHFINALLIEIPHLPIEGDESGGETFQQPDRKIMEVYGGGDTTYSEAVEKMLKDVVDALPYIYFTGFAMETRSRPVFTPINALLNVTFNAMNSKVPPLLIPSTRLTTLKEVEDWFNTFNGIQPTGTQLIKVLKREDIPHIFMLRDKVHEVLSKVLSEPGKT